MSLGMRHLQVAVCVVCCTVAAAAQQSGRVPPQHVGRVLDWTSHHITVSGGLDAVNLRAAQADPRGYPIR